MDLYKKQFGAKGEDHAVLYLKKKRFVIIDRNFRIQNGEIDIIALDPTKKILVFIEVKTRTSAQFGTPFEAITPWKMRALIRTAAFYKQTHENLPDQMRIDAIAILLRDSNTTNIEHMENIGG